MLNERQYQFNQEFNEYIKEAASRFVPDTGWTKGHSRSLTNAIQNWLGAAAKPYMITQHKDATFANHTFVNIGGHFLDGDGLSDFKEMKHRWTEERSFRNFFIQPFDSEKEEPHIVTGLGPLYLPEEDMQKLTVELTERFNPFETLKLLGSQYTPLQQATIIEAPSPIAWWSDGVGQVCSVLAVYPETGYVNVVFTRTEEQAAFESTYQISGWIPPQFLKFEELVEKPVA